MRAFTSILTIAALAASAVAVPFTFELGARNETETFEKRDFGGQFTWYDISVGETACGGFNQPYEYVSRGGSMFMDAYLRYSRTGCRSERRC